MSRLQCPAGHSVRADHTFCTECGQPVTTATASPADEADAQRSGDIPETATAGQSGWDGRLTMLERLRTLSLGKEIALGLGAIVLIVVGALFVFTNTDSDSDDEFFNEGISIMSGEEVAAELQSRLPYERRSEFLLRCDPLDEVEGATTICFVGSRSVAPGILTVTYERDGTLTYEANPE